MKLPELMEGRQKCSIFQTYLDNKNYCRPKQSSDVAEDEGAVHFGGVARQKIHTLDPTGDRC